MKKSKFLACLRSILLLEKNGGDEKVVEKNYYEVLGEDLHKIVTDLGYSGIGDPAFLEDHSDIIVSVENDFKLSYFFLEQMLRKILWHSLGRPNAMCEFDSWPRQPVWDNRVWDRFFTSDLKI